MAEVRDGKETISDSKFPGGAGSPGRPVPWWLRAFLVLGAIQGIGLGLTGFVAPAEIQIPYQMSPLNARFIGSLYLAAAIGALLAAFARRREETRLFVVGLGVATGLIMLVTLLHWSEFMADPLPHRVSWIAAYVGDPLLAVAVIVAARFAPLRIAGRHRFSSLLVAECIILGLLGAALLLLPDAVAVLWPWALPPVLGQLYGCFFLALSVGAFIAARESADTAVRNYLLASLALAVFVLLASVLHLARFKSELAIWVWIGSFAVAAAIFASALLLGAIDRRAWWRRATPVS